MPEPIWYKRLWAKISRPKIPPAIRPNQFIVGSVILMSVIASVSQGFDYIARPQEEAWTLSVIEQALPLDVWGWLFVVFAVFALIGDTFNIWPMATFGHGALSIAYIAIGTGVVWSLILNWHGYGWQLAFLYVGVGMFHVMVADGCYDEWVREWDRAPRVKSVRNDGP